MPKFASVDDYLSSLPAEQREVYPVPPAGDPDLDADLASYAGARGTLKLPYPEADYALIERVVRRLLETRTSRSP
ncbi:hypothetical protein NYO98_00175 [Nocardioides sp. STR2]|uniref:Uncharacterized protein n=1 Tax=Nocardioides pini TaxID=2975053 RepID=A0ABT4C6V1_9ACTN|nr:hypothetical protein [Nocardioides pini]MCY4724675.1 hypothetical protein [Nocardioides pini]